MMGTTHAMGAAAVWLAGCAVLGPPAPTVIAAGAGLAVAGGLAPDIDHRNAGAAKVARMAGLALVGAAGFAALTATSHHDWRLWAIIGAVVGLAPWLLRPRGGGFRGCVHSRLGLVVCLAAAWLPLVFWSSWWPWWAALAVSLGWVSHLALDALTKEGLPWAWEPGRRGPRFGWLPKAESMRTGGKRKRGKGRRGRVGLEYRLVQPVLVVALAGLGWLLIGGV
jgi:hypothetical protein